MPSVFFLLEHPRRLCLHVPLFRKEVERPQHQLTAASIARLGSRSKTQLDGWRCAVERHEQIALGQKIAGSEVEMKKWLDGVEKKIGGSGK